MESASQRVCARVDARARDRVLGRLRAVRVERLCVVLTEGCDADLVLYSTGSIPPYTCEVGEERELGR